ncbi:MAG: hypothetical protein ACR2QM_05480 [Longimicrobiales bacterium]
MKLIELQAVAHGVSVPLGNAVGLAGFVAGGGPYWGAIVSGLHDAYRSGGRYVGPGPTVEIEGASVTIGSQAFEQALQRTIGPLGLGREGYGAIWFGAGSVDDWLTAGRVLLQGPEVTERISQITALLQEGDQPKGAVPRSVGDWVTQLTAEAEADVERLRASEANVLELEAKLLALRADAAEVAGDVEVGIMAWVRERQDAETRLLLYRDREQALRQRIDALEEQGVEAECGSCGRALDERLEQVLKDRSEEWEAVVQDGRWWRRRRDQLEYKPDELKEVESRALELGSQVDVTAESLERSRVQLRELEIGRVRLQHLEALAEQMGGLGGKTPTPLSGEQPGEPGQASRQLADMKERLEATSDERFRARVHAKVVALTGGRLVGGFPALFQDWSVGGRRGGGEVSILELATRICLAEMALSAGLKLDSIILPTALDRLNGEDLPRALADLGRLARKIRIVIVKATEEVASASPERFDLLFRVDAAKAAAKIVAQRSGLGWVYLTDSGMG